MASRSSDGSLCQRALRIISQRACDGLTVKEMLRELRVSRLALERALAAHVGKTPGRMLKEARLARAQELLAGTALPIKQIAQAVGYVKPSNFGDFFRARMGQSPQEYRSAQRYRTRTAETAGKPGESRRALSGSGIWQDTAIGGVGEQIEHSYVDLNRCWLGWDRIAGIDAKSVMILLGKRQFGGYYTSDAVSAAAYRGLLGEIDA